jgi:5-methylcytosine-specific restriction endonuclease McrA
MSSNSSYLRDRHQQRLLWALELLGGCCIRCGSIEGLEFDHIDRTTKVANISDKLSRWSIARLMDELQKCQLLCKDCHLKKGREVGDVQPEAPHGANRYQRYGCKCEICVEAYRERCREAMRRLRAKKSNG